MEDLEISITCAKKQNKAHGQQMSKIGILRKFPQKGSFLPKRKNLSSSTVLKVYF